MLKGKLIKQLPDPAQAIPGMMTCQHDVMLWWDDPTKEGGVIQASLHNPRILSASSHGILLSGKESCGVDKHGREKFVYQEWWITP